MFYHPFTIIFWVIYAFTESRLLDRSKMGNTCIEHWKLTSLCISLYTNYICQKSSTIIKKFKRSQEKLWWRQSLMLLTTPKKTMTLLSKNIPVFWKIYALTLYKHIWCIFKQPSTLLSYIHETFWINLAIHTWYEYSWYKYSTNYVHITLRSKWRIMQEWPLFITRRCSTWKKIIRERGTRWSADVFVYQSQKCHLHQLAKIMT